MPEPRGVLITGASGFLGTWLSNAAYDQGFELIGVDRVAPPRPEIFSAFATENCERTDFAALVGSRKLDAAFHLAGGASIAQSLENPLGDFETLLPGTVALLIYLGRHQRDAHLVFFSSAAVYGNPSTLPVPETAPAKPISPYGIHKAAAEFIIEHYARLFGLRASLLRVFSAYGEGLRKQVVWDICQRILTAQKRGEQAISLRGTGTETRDFIYAADIARAAFVIAKRPPWSGTQVLNVGSGEETSIRALAETIVRCLDTKLGIVFDGVRRPGDPVNWRADINRLTALGFSLTIPWEQGVARTVSACRQ
jgi:UDP-glucose 4-epimerase